MRRVRTQKLGGAVLLLWCCACWVLAQEAPPAGTQAALESAATLLSAGRVREALEALAPVERDEPDNPWLWFYTGTARFQLGEPYTAMEAYDRALDILSDLGDPDPALAGRVREHRLKARQQIFRLSLRTGLAYDTNVTYLGAGASALGFISGRRDGSFESQFQVDYAPIATSTDGLAIGVRLPQSWHFAVEEFDYHDYGGYVRYTRKLDDRWSAAIQYDYDFAYLGLDPFLSSHILTPSLNYNWVPTNNAFQLNRTSVYYRLEADDFRFKTLRSFDRDGLGHGIGLEQTVQIRPIPNIPVALDAFLGYRFDSFVTNGTEFDRREHNFYAGCEVPLVNPCAPEQYLLIADRPLKFRFNAQWQIGDYLKASLLDADRDKRSDQITTLNFGLSQTLLQDVQVGELILHGLISWTDADSNITTARPHSTPFTYDKVIYGVQLEWTW